MSQKFLEKIKKAGVKVNSAFSDYSKSFTESIKEVFADAKFQADHFHIAKNIWKYLRKCFLEYRKEIKKDGENQNNEHSWKLRQNYWNYGGHC
ncbi:MAG: transposase [Desulfobacteraceae bacterium]|nr:transposase [Desulfobacteraceae bacterium]